MSYHRSTMEAAKGKWRGILLEFGLPEACLKDKHGPCPLCQSEKNFRWDNKDGNGSYICTCGSGPGAKLACEFMGKTFKQVADEIDLMIGNIKVDSAPPRRDMSDEDRRLALREVYAATKQVVPGDLADTYLKSRGFGELIYPKALRFAGALRDGEGGVRPCMVATVTDTEGKAVSLHRTFLRPDGLAKAEMEAPRKMMPGALPDGACVRLSDGPSASLGIAEGLETALAASVLYGLPVWAALTATMLAKWIPPEGVEDITIFADNDPKFGGQAAAYQLAHRLAVKGWDVTVLVPALAGADFNDELNRRKAIA